MADTLTLTAGADATPPAGTVIATDDAGAAGQVQIVKLADPTNGSATPLGDLTNGYPVNVTRVVPGTSATHLGKAEDAAHASGDTGVMALAVRKDTPTALAGTDGDYAPFEVDSTGRLHSNTEMADAVAAGDAMANPTTAPVIAHMGVWSADGLGTSWQRVYGGFLNADAHDANKYLAGAAAYNYLYNGASEDRQRGNTEGTLLASAARTATTNSADQTNHNARGVRVAINVTSITSSPSVTVAIQEKDPISGNYVDILVSAAITSTGQKTTLVLYPGATGVANSVLGQALPRTWRVAVTHGNSDSITYSVAYALIV